MIDILEQMGFSHLTGTLYNHAELGTVSFHDLSPKGIATTLVWVGSRKKEEQICKALGVKHE